MPYDFRLISVDRLQKLGRTPSCIAIVEEFSVLRCSAMVAFFCLEA